MAVAERSRRLLFCFSGLFTIANTLSLGASIRCTPTPWTHRVSKDYIRHPWDLLLVGIRPTNWLQRPSNPGTKSGWLSHSSAKLLQPISAIEALPNTAESPFTGRSLEPPGLRS